MLNYLWGGMFLAGIIYGAFAGTLPQITEGLLSGAKEAVELCLSVAGIVAFWTGLMTVAKETGFLRGIAAVMRPFLLWMMPELKNQETALEAVSVNLAANILGLGWAATAAGLTAMEELDKMRDIREKNSKEKTATEEMCVLLILNISSLQLIPVSTIAYRSQYGSTDPVAVAGPGFLATLASTLAAIVFCRVLHRGRKVAI
ncbi:MAG: nucleoside recognition protein [Lachnospiraceae bacterium]